ncbi:MAG: S-layer homology domain-containing protein [Candidatus Pristimantibacillus lignocellulolyticus]|uniref:S-layer homology domain-containing protein n=1 Tax=Candidatus Pristimantibacillus lignocellulolyticus TaxID=2994561 RepID=A0A9J6ZIN6_9BACL|nr:MAG: S-layer homology domain-containing protein [Candidatus Pristimantibacillus lignocellulolyticus]
MKKFLSIVLTLALFVSLLPMYGTTNQAEAAGSYFLFPNEKDTKASARIVSNKIISLTGTINGVVGSSISYKVQQVTANSDTPLNSTQDISTGITTTGDNRMTVSALELFAGMNKITFKGVAGTSTVEESIYIEFRDSPMLTDLNILFENRSYAVEESGVTMLYSNAAVPTDTGIITLEGYAPNASKVTVEINNYTYDFNVSTSTSNYRFSTSQLSIKKGMNTIKFKVTNGGQVVETTRQVALYNGEVTHYDEKLTSDNKAYNVTYGGEYSIDGTKGLTLTGKAIIPTPIYDLTTSTTTPIDLTSPTAATAITNAFKNNIKISIAGETVNPTVTINGQDPTAITSTTKYVTVSYSFNLAQIAQKYNSPITYTIQAPNTTQYDVSDERRIILRDSTKSYIADINYLSGFDSTMTSAVPNSTTTSKANNVNQLKSLQGTDIGASGVDVYSIPMAVELLVANASNVLGSLSQNLTDAIKLKINGSTYGYKVIVDSNGYPVKEVVTQTVNGVSTEYLRVFLQLDKLAKTGTNNAEFSLVIGQNTDTKSAIFKLQYGPYVKYENVVDGMSINYDSYKDTNTVLIEKLGGLAGRIMNIANNSDIRYEAQTSPAAPVSVFMYLNNVQVAINSYDKTNAKNSPLFRPDGITIDSTGKITGVDRDKASELAAIMNKAGENTLKFVFITDTYNYESTIKFNIVPTNLPTIPAVDTDGVYPYTVGKWPPTSNDANFNNSGGIFTTKQADFNVYGTFDFIDLGTDDTQINATLGTPGTPGKITPTDYKVTISNPDWKTDVKWDLSKQFKETDGRRNIQKLSTGADKIHNSTASDASTPDANITFYYDKENQNFFFDISNQSMPEDGSPLVYVISVFNAGDGGPRATYRLEVNPISIPYSIKSPVVEERITNQNFVELIISAPGAESLTVGKTAAEKVAYLDYSNGQTTTVNAFRTVVSDLKANKDTKISFTITRGDTKITDSITVKYVPTNIPGAKYLETMKKSHKVFNNSLTLTFQNNTNLIRPKYNESSNSATQVYNGHEILFAIANPDDGIVDRHMFESQPPDYSADSQATGYLHIKNRFDNQASRFIKASPLYWIDAGLADNPDVSSPQYDPITTGLDPYPFPNIAGKYTENFANRYYQFGRELAPSAPGSLTLTYDNSIVSSAGTTVTVFRFDPYNSTWENIGGVVDTKKGTITVPFTKFGYYVAVKLTRSYNDITDHSYAREAMEAIYSKGIMNAVEPVNQFGGDRYVTRGEFTRMIVRALDLPLNYSGSLHFTYYPETITNASNANAIYDYRYIETAARAGIVNGTRPGFFDEDVQISRQDAAVILARALELKLETNSTKAKTQLDKAFKDGGNFDFYSIPAVLAIQKKGFIVGKPINTADPKEGYMFDPKARMLRSDAAIIMARVMADMKKLPTIYN